MKLSNYLHLNLVDGSCNNYQLHNIEILNDISNSDLLLYFGNHKEMKFNSRQNYLHVLYDFIYQGIIFEIGIDNILNYTPHIKDSIIIYNAPSFVTIKDIESIFSEFPHRVPTTLIKIDKIFNYNSLSHFYIKFNSNWEINDKCVQFSLSKDRQLMCNKLNLGDFTSKYQHIQNPLLRQFYVNIDYAHPVTSDTFFSFECGFSNRPKDINDAELKTNNNTKLNSILEDYLYYKNSDFICFKEYSIFKKMNDFQTKTQFYNYLKNPCKLKCIDIDDLPDYNGNYTRYSKYEFITWYNSDLQWCNSLQNDIVLNTNSENQNTDLYSNSTLYSEQIENSDMIYPDKDSYNNLSINLEDKELDLMLPTLHNIENYSNDTSDLSEISLSSSDLSETKDKIKTYNDIDYNELIEKLNNQYENDKVKTIDTYYHQIEEGTYQESKNKYKNWIDLSNKLCEFKNNISKQNLLNKNIQSENIYNFLKKKDDKIPNMKTKKYNKNKVTYNLNTESDLKEDYMLSYSNKNKKND